MKKIIWIGLAGLLIGAATHVSATEVPTSHVGITFYQSEKKTIPLTKVDVPISKEGQEKKDESLSFLPKTNEKENRVIKIVSVITLISSLSILKKRRRRDEKES